MKKLTFCLFFLVWYVHVIAQNPVPCPASGVPPADNCMDACVLCNLNGLSGSNAGYTGYFFPAYCGTVERDLWIAFVASGTSGQFTASPSNCTNGNGIQIALFDKCPPFPPLICNMGGSGFGDTPVSISYDEFVPGKTYFLQIDGYSGDECDYILTVDPPSFTTASGPPGPTPPISGPLTTCPGAVETYSLPAVALAGYYTWTAPPGTLINGLPSPVTLPAPEGDSVSITWGISGGTLCVQPANACYAGTVACLNVSVQPIPPTVLPPVTVCAEDVPYLLPWGDSVQVSGLYQTTLASTTGCDSTIRQNVIVKAPIVVNPGQKVICAGECLSVCGSQYCNNGSYTAVCSSAQGCDSTVQFSLLVLSASIEAPNGKTITCAMPEVELDGYPVSPATWTNSMGQVISGSPVAVVDTPGFYTYSSTASLGSVFCLVEKTVLVKQNTQIPDVTASGGVLDAAHPTVQLMGHSVIQPVQYHWTGPDGFVSQLPNPTVNVPGPYTLTVVNTGNGCSNSITVEVIQQ